MAAREIKTTIAIDGEKQFKSALSEAQRSLRVLQAELKAETSAFDASTSAQARAQTRASSLRAQIEQQKKVVEALRGAVADSAKKWGENSQQADGYRIKLANAQKTLSDMTHDLGEAEKASDGLNRSFRETMKAMGPEFKNTLSAAGDVLSTIGTAGAAAFGAVTAAAGGAAAGVAQLVGETSTKADDLLTLSLQTGIDVQTLQAWSYASRFIDTEVSSITDSIKKLRQNMQKGDAQTGLNDALLTLGVSAKDGADRYRDAVDVFWDVIDAAHENIRGLNETELDTALQTLTGRGYTDLLPLISAGRQSWEEMVSRAYSGGLVMDQATVDAFGAYNDTLQQIDASWAGIKESMAAIALDYAQPVATGVANVATAFNRMLRGEDGAGEDLAASVDRLFADAKTALTEGWNDVNETIAALQGSDSESAQKLGGALGTLRDGLADIYANRDGYVKALEALFAVMVGTKAAKAATTMIELGKGVGQIVKGAAALGVLTPTTAALGAAGGMVAYGASHPERSALQPEYYRAATGTDTDMENLRAWIAAQNAANAATFDPDTSSEAIETARLLNEAAQAARDALLATEGGRDLNERYAAYLSTVDGYDGTVMPDVPPEWAEQIGAKIQGALDAAALEIDPMLAESWAKNTRETLQAYLNGMSLSVDVAANLTGLGGAGTGRWVDSLVGGAADRADGSHAGGLDYVPFDGYRALLHRGERVLTAGEAAASRTGGGGAQAGGMTMRQALLLLRAALAGVTVQLDGEAVGHLVAGTVSGDIALEILEG